MEIHDKVVEFLLSEGAEVTCEGNISLTRCRQLQREATTRPWKYYSVKVPRSTRKADFTGNALQAAVYRDKDFFELDVRISRRHPTNHHSSNTTYL